MYSLAYSIYTASIGLLGWVFIDSLRLRVDIRTVLKAVATILLGIGAVSQLFFHNGTAFIFLTSAGLYAFYTSFIFDEHATFGLGIILMIISFFLLRGNGMISAQAGLIAFVILQLSYTTSHRDLIPLGVAFVLMCVAEFLKYQGDAYTQSGDLLYVFVGIFFIIWIWQYLAPRIRMIWWPKQSS